MSSQTCYQDSHSQRQRKGVQIQYQLQSWTSIPKPLQPHAANLTGQTSDSSTWSEMTISNTNQTSMNKSDMDSNTDPIYNIDFGETPEQWFESEAELCNFNQTSAQACNFI